LGPHWLATPIVVGHVNDTELVGKPKVVPQLGMLTDAEVPTPSL
jgi:hypothetical protein